MTRCFFIFTRCKVTIPGCGIESRNPGSYGSIFNSEGGGLYALEWTIDGIQAWFWNEGSIPSDALDGSNPDPSSWGIPYANFPFGDYCPSSKFKGQQVIFDLTFCGDWAGPAFAKDCPGKGGCKSYVQNNPEAFEQAYWQIHWLKIFAQE